jgi:hypothetical protein
MTSPLTPRRAIVALALSAVGLSFLWPMSASATAQRTVAQKHAVAPCAPTQITTALELLTLGKLPTSPAGAVLFHNTSGTACSLRGVPTVGVVNQAGQRIAVFQRSSTPRRPVAAVLRPSSSGQAAGSSLTWSSWSCSPGSYTLTIRFPGWSTSVPATWGSIPPPDGPCAVTGATIYVGPVATITH